MAPKFLSKVANKLKDAAASVTTTAAVEATNSSDANANANANTSTNSVGNNNADDNESRQRLGLRAIKRKMSNSVAAAKTVAVSVTSKAASTVAKAAARVNPSLAKTSTRTSYDAAFDDIDSITISDHLSNGNASELRRWIRPPASNSHPDRMFAIFEAEEARRRAMFASFGDLPLELIDMIIAPLAQLQQIRILAVCRTFYSIAAPRAWSSVPEKVFMLRQSRFVHLLKMYGEFVKTIDLRAVPDFGYIPKAVVKYCTNASSVIIGSYFVHQALMPRNGLLMETWIQLRRLDLSSNTFLTAADLQVIADMTNLGENSIEELHFAHVERAVTDEQAVSSFYSGLGKLKKLGISVDDGDKLLRTLAVSQSPHLEEFKVSGLMHECRCNANRQLFASTAASSPPPESSPESSQSHLQSQSQSQSQPQSESELTYSRLQRLECLICCNSSGYDYADWKPERFPRLSALRLLLSTPNCIVGGRLPVRDTAVSTIFGSASPQWTSLTTLDICFALDVATLEHVVNAIPNVVTFLANAAAPSDVEIQPRLEVDRLIAQMPKLRRWRQIGHNVHMCLSNCSVKSLPVMTRREPVVLSLDFVSFTIDPIALVAALRTPAVRFLTLKDCSYDSNQVLQLLEDKRIWIKELQLDGQPIVWQPETLSQFIRHHCPLLRSLKLNGKTARF